MCVCVHPHLFAVLANVGVNLVEGTEHVKFTGVKSCLFSQIGIHVLIGDGWQSADVSVVPVGTARGRYSMFLLLNDWLQKNDSILFIYTNAEKKFLNIHETFILPFYPVLVVGDIFSIKQFI